MLHKSVNANLSNSTKREESSSTGEEDETTLPRIPPGTEESLDVSDEPESEDSSKSNDDQPQTATNLSESSEDADEDDHGFMGLSR